MKTKTLHAIKTNSFAFECDYPSLSLSYQNSWNIVAGAMKYTYLTVSNNVDRIREKCNYLFLTCTYAGRVV